MDCIEIRDLTFTYPDREFPALSNLNLTVRQGEFVTLCGRSGCGKTTLLRQLKPAIAPHGTRTGEIFLEGRPLSRWDRRAQSEKIGFVLQSPERQMVTDKVWHELAFGLESLGFKTPEIRARVAETAAFFGIEGWFHRDVAELSGGQKQLLNLAAVMAAGPSVLLLDEPTGQLDPIAASEFLGALSRLNRELGVTVLLSEQRLEEVIPLSDRVVVLSGGTVTAGGAPFEAGEKLRELGHEMFFAMPTPMRVWAAVPNRLRCPVTVGEGRAWLFDYAKEHPLDPASIPEHTAEARSEKSAVRLSEVWFRYEKNGPDVLRGLSLDIREGELFAVLGGNGAGKTTALKIVSGLARPQRGKAELFGEPLSSIPERRLFGGLLGVLPQDPRALFVKNTVGEDLLEVLRDTPVPEEERRRRADEMAELCGLHHLRQCHPYDLSGGEQQRAALAKVLLTGPRILLLDEPTKGLDVFYKEELAKLLYRLCIRGVAVVMVSHDVEFCARHAGRCALIFDGAAVSEGEPRDFFAGKNFYTTAANRMARALLPEAVTAEDLISACGGREERSAPPPEGNNGPPASPAPDGEKTAGQPCTPERRKFPAGAAASLFALLLVVPLTIYFGLAFLEDRAYYLISLLILLEATVPFLLLFERRRLRARELVVIAVLCALAVGGRAAFFMVPEVKPMTALVILTGAAFGGETGFVAGALSAFVSNLFFGQGPWTPWQMFALGLIGFLSGVLFRGQALRWGKPALCLFGGGAALVIYGGILNPATVLLAQERPTAGLFLTAYAMGLPFDLIHAGATALFLWLFSGPMTEKLQRMKRKYGLLTSESAVSGKRNVI